MSKFNPDHYRLGAIEPWDFIVSQDMDFLTGNVIKYLTRAGHKAHESKLGGGDEGAANDAAEGEEA